MCISIDRIRSAKNVTKENSKFVYQDSRNSGKTEDCAQRSKQNGIARFRIYSIFTICHPMFSFHIYTYSLSKESEEWSVATNGIWDFIQTNRSIEHKISALFFILIHYSLEFSGHLNALTKNEETKNNTTVAK